MSFAREQEQSQSFKNSKTSGKKIFPLRKCFFCFFFKPCDRAVLHWEHLPCHGWIMAALPGSKADELLIGKRQKRGKWKFKMFNNYTIFILLLKGCGWELNDWITWGVLVKAASGGSISHLFWEHLSRVLNYKVFLFNCQTEFSVFLRRWVNVDPGVSPFLVIGFDL